MENEFLQETFGSEALTFEQFNEKLGGNSGIKLVNAADGSYVPKADYDNINSQLLTARKESKDNAEKYADFDEKLQAAKDEGAAALNAYKLDVAVSNAFKSANVADEVSVKANLNMENVKFDDEGKLTGLDEQLAELQKNKPFLFTQPIKKLSLGGSAAGAGAIKSTGGIKGAVAEFYGK